MYEEEDEDLPRHLRNFTHHLQSGNPDFNTRLANYVIVQFGGLEAALEGMKKAESERQHAEANGQNVAPTLTNFFPQQFQGNAIGIQQQIAIQQSQLFGHPVPQQFMQQNVAPNMMHMNSQRQMSYPQTPYGMQSQQQLHQVNQHLSQQFTPQPQQYNGMNNQMQQHVQPLQLTDGNLQLALRIRSGSARNSNSPLPSAQSPILLTPAQTNQERSASASAATPMPSIEVDSKQHSRNNKVRQSLSNNSSSSGNGSNEYLQQESNAESLFGMQPDYNYNVGADIFATATPGTNQGGDGFFQPHHFSNGFNGDPLQAMFQIGSDSHPFGNDLHNSFAANGSYGIKQENGQSTPGQATLAPKHLNMNSNNASVNQYMQGMDSSAEMKAENNDETWNDWTNAIDYHHEEEVD